MGLVGSALFAVIQAEGMSDDSEKCRTEKERKPYNGLRSFCQGQ